MEWLAFLLFFEASYFPMQDVCIYEDQRMIRNQTYSFNFGAEVRLFDIYFIKGDVDCVFKQNAEADFNFGTNFDNYKFGAGVEPIKGLVIGYEHMCTHPVLAYYPQDVLKIKQIFEAAYDRFYVRIETKFNFDKK